jgi:hypothetical protein
VDPVAVDVEDGGGEREHEDASVGREREQGEERGAGDRERRHEIDVVVQMVDSAGDDWEVVEDEHRHGEGHEACLRALDPEPFRDCAIVLGSAP